MIESSPKRFEIIRRFYENAEQPERKKEAVFIASDDTEFYGQAGAHLRKAFATTKFIRENTIPELAIGADILDLRSMFPGGKKLYVEEIDFTENPLRKINLGEFQI